MKTEHTRWIPLVLGGADVWMGGGRVDVWAEDLLSPDMSSQTRFLLFPTALSQMTCED